MNDFPQMLHNEPLSKHTTMLVGGPADYFYPLRDLSELEPLLEFAKKHNLPYFVMGGGANIVFHDNGFRGLVIKMQSQNIVIENNTITADAGVMVTKMVKETLDKGLSGLEKWYNLPGTVGGAVRGNAGCNGLETKDIFVSAVVFDPETGKPKTVDNAYFNFKYRDSLLKHNNEILLKATFALEKEPLDKDTQKKILEEVLRFRHEKQPYGASSGSFFKNPSPENPAGKLIEEAGLKGKTIDKAQISEKHANFIVNLGGAHAKDIIELVMLAKREVKAKFGINLEEEVQIMSETGKVQFLQ